MKCDETYLLHDRMDILEKNIEIMVEMLNEITPQLRQIWEKLGCRPVWFDFDD